jgi:hypothetical protein
MIPLGLLGGLAVQASRWHFSIRFTLHLLMPLITAGLLVRHGGERFRQWELEYVSISVSVAVDLPIEAVLYIWLDV